MTALDNDSSDNNSSPAPAIERAPAIEPFRLLLEINNALVRNLDLRELLAQVSGCIRRALQHDYSSLCLYDPLENRFTIHAVDFPKGLGSIRQELTFPLED